MGLFSKEKSSPPNPGFEQPLPAYTAEASYSSPPQFQTRFASLSLHEEDKLRFLRFPTGVVDLCRETVHAVWKKGFKEEKEYGGSIELKVHGHPWRGGNVESVQGSRLLNAILRTLHGQGWVLSMSTDVSKKMYDKDTLLFRHQVPAPSEHDWCSIVFSKSDRLKFVDAPSEVAHALAGKLGQPAIKELSTISQGVNEIKLGRGLSWLADGTDTMKVRGLLLTLLETLEEEGWTVYASVDQKTNYSQYVSNADCYALLSFQRSDRLTFQQFPTPVVNLCRDLIIALWPKGIKKEEGPPNALAIKVNGQPWSPRKMEIHATRLVAAMLRTLYGQGWVLAFTADFKSFTYDHDELVFKYQVPAPPECDWCAIMFKKWAKINFLGAPYEDVELLAAKLGKPTVPHMSKLAPDMCEFHLDRQFTLGRKNFMIKRALLLDLIEALDEMGWKVYAGVNQGYDYQDNHGVIHNPDCVSLLPWSAAQNQFRT